MAIISAAQPVRFAMVGGGEGAFIGEVHRMAAALAANCRLLAGAFGSDAGESARLWAAIGLAPERVDADWREMISAEVARPVDERIDFVAVVIPNHLHAGPAICALEAGLAMLCDKPLAGTMADARRSRRRRAGPGAGRADPHLCLLSHG